MSGMNINTVDGGFISSGTFNAGTASSVSVIAAVAGQKIRVYKLAISAIAANTIQFLDGSTAISGPFNMGSGTPLILPMDGNPWLVTSTGNALNATLTSALNIAGLVWFTQNANI